MAESNSAVTYIWISSIVALLSVVQKILAGVRKWVRDRLGERGTQPLRA
jgi:hypothetical protein